MEKIDLAKAEEYILYKAIAGSKVYGLDTPTSDTDIRGIYLLPNEYRLSNDYYVGQVADDKNDTVLYDLNRFVELLTLNNPNIIELLFTPEDKILYFNNWLKPLFDNRDKFLTKKIKDTFGGYSISQIKKARGLNKKIVNPVDKERKTPLDFCYIYEKENGYMMLAKQWLDKYGISQDHIGLAELPNGIQAYKVYYDNSDILGFRGIVSENSNEIRHSEIPKNYLLKAFLYYNKDGYSSYCKDYKEYWDWVEKRNKARYNDNTSHGQNYDGKNLSCCLRLLDMAIEIGEGKGVILRRPNREFLLSIRKGSVPYDDIIAMIEEKRQKLHNVFEKCDLPDNVDIDFANDIIMQIRSKQL